MALLKYRDSCQGRDKNKHRSVYFGSVVWTLLVIAFSVLIFGILAENFPVKSQSDARASRLPTSRSPTAAELVPIHSGNPGGSTSLGGGTSFGGSPH